MEVKPYVPTFKCLLLGDSRVGKTSYIRRHLTGDFTKNYTTTLAAEIHAIPFNTNTGTVIFNVFDAKNLNSQCGIQEGLYHYTECAIIMFDVQSHVSYKNVAKWHANIVKFCGDIPVSLCGNKVDAKFRSVHPKEITFHYDKYMNYYEISAKCNYNFEKPFLWLATELLKDKNLSFMVLPKLAPADVKLDVPFQLKIEQEIREARRIFRLEALKKSEPRFVDKGTQKSFDSQPPTAQSSRLFDKRRKASLLTLVGSRSKTTVRTDDHKSLVRSPSLRYSKEALQVWLNTASLPAMYKKPSLATESIVSIKESPRLKRKSASGKRALTAQTCMRMQRIESQSDVSKSSQQNG